MSVAVRQALVHSEKRVVQAPTTDGKQVIQQNGFKHHFFFWAWFVQQEELQDTLNSAIPAPYVPEGEPSISEIESTRLYNIVWKGVHYSNEPLGGGNTGSDHSGDFY